MSRSSAAIFISGRLTALVVLVAFQICLVHILLPSEYAAYALTFATGSLMQTALSFGIPRVIPKFVTRAGWNLPNVAVARLVRRLLGGRAAGTAAILFAGSMVALAMGWAPTHLIPLLLVGGAFIVVTVVQLDLDAVAQALTLQHASRKMMTGEAITRFILVVAGALLGGVHTAVGVLSISLATSLGASGVLAHAIATSLRQPDSSAELGKIDPAELRSTALSGYASAMAWFASSPSIIRVLAGATLPTIAFAGFAFAQSLVLSIQRYTPAMLLFPFIEPSVMRNYHRTGDRTRLQCALSLIVKIDGIVIGAGLVATLAAGPAMIDLLTAGRYTALAGAIPFLLVYIATNSVYRAFEIVAITLGTGSALGRSLIVSLIWLGAAILLSRHFGLIALLLCPIGDALSRLAMMHHALRARDVRHVVDVPVTAGIAALVVVCGGAGWEAASLAGSNLLAIVIGAAAAACFLGGVVLLRPFRGGELGLVTGHAPARVASMLEHYLKRDS